MNALGNPRIAGTTLAALTAAAFLAPPAHAQRSGTEVYRIPITGVIELGLAPFVERSLKEAAAQGAAAAVLDIETPGGRIDAAQRIANAVSDAEIPVYAFINHRAFSAGALISLAADRIYMRPGSVIGAATPVEGTGEKAPEKIVSAMRSEMRALAEARGLDPAIAEAMVDEDIAIAGVVDGGKLLTLTTSEAVALGYAEEVADYDALLAELGVAEARTVQTEVNWAEGLVRFFTHPVVAPFLLSLGFLGLLVEIKTPTFGLAGIAGIGSLALFFGSHYLVGLAGMEEVLLLAAGLILLGVEIFIVPGFGVFGVGGILALLASIYLSLVGQFSTAADYSEAGLVLSAAMILMLMSSWVLIRSLPDNKRLIRSNVILGGRLSKDTGYVSAKVRADLVGAEGVTLTALRPSGSARVKGERVDVVADSGWMEAGVPVRVVRAEGYRTLVEAVEEPGAQIASGRVAEERATGDA
ncbi:MAG TPA: NfeD family protein [Longimicrobiales bacterium]|nr:NfeD family protein [Longimicrobiales bacterium]